MLKGGSKLEKQETEETVEERLVRLVNQNQNRARAYWLATPELTRQYFWGLMTWSNGNYPGMSQTELWVVNQREMDWDDFLDQVATLIKDHPLPIYYNHRMTEDDIRAVKQHFPTATVDRAVLN
ncbi:hypothetical protein HC019_02310 [Limosilactobacillus fermentum]|nr:hypothetical protein [Limosilactobacillus fermentum]PTS41044.1 hypothetical protein DBQ14_00245 [Limosilactobacillus fermentum]PTV37347.1 hypothetical protein DB329_00545 [Limosilactobacillus fermentum]QAR23379.1 hypothetical protein EQG56_02490 [Limosilactobacillus fermentum]